MATALGSLLALAGIGTTSTTSQTGAHPRPRGGRFLGVIDLSTTWEKSHPTLLTTVAALHRATLDAMDPADARRSIVVGRMAAAETA